MTIITLHTIDKNPETNEVLAEVIATMRTMGAPVIRAFDLGDGRYAAAEGCHRIEAAHRLGLVPVLDILDLGDIDADEDIMMPADLANEMGMEGATMAHFYDCVDRWASNAKPSQEYEF